MSSEATIPTPRLAAPESAAVTAPRVSTGPERPLDIRALLHPAEHSRLLIALSSSAVVFGVAAMIVYKSSGWTALISPVAEIISRIFRIMDVSP